MFENLGLQFRLQAVGETASTRDSKPQAPPGQTLFQNAVSPPQSEFFVCFARFVVKQVPCELF